MIDVDCKKLLPQMLEDFEKNFALSRELLPGGTHCMMNAVSDAHVRLISIDLPLSNISYFS